MYPKIIVQNFGPFEYAELELRPLTILIGKNNVGKSMLAYLVWTLASTMPDFDKLADVVTEYGAPEIADKILEVVEAGRNPQDDLRKLLEIYINALPEAIASAVNRARRRLPQSWTTLFLRASKRLQSTYRDHAQH